MSVPFWFVIPPSIHDARSPGTITQRSRRHDAPRATFTGSGRPSFSSRSPLRSVTNSSRCSSPAKNDVWLGMRGSSDVPNAPSGPGAVGDVSDGPSEALSV